MPSDRLARPRRKRRPGLAAPRRRPLDLPYARSPQIPRGCAESSGKPCRGLRRPAPPWTLASSMPRSSRSLARSPSPTASSYRESAWSKGKSLSFTASTISSRRLLSSSKDPYDSNATESRPYSTRGCAGSSPVGAAAAPSSMSLAMRPSTPLTKRGESSSPPKSFASSTASLMATLVGTSSTNMIS